VQLIAGAAVMGAGCEDASESTTGGSTGDCAERLVWQGREYAGLRHRPPLGEPVGTTTLRCDGEPSSRVQFLRLKGVDTSVAIGVRPKGKPRLVGGPYVGLGPGYVVQSPRHPFHRAVFGADDEPDEYQGRRCDPPRTVLARALNTPLADRRGLVVAAERPSDQTYLNADFVRGSVSFDVSSEIRGFDRGGVPYVERGDRFRLRLRACVLDAGSDDKGSRRLVVVRLDRIP
jgi:hypothetical protein